MPFLDAREIAVRVPNALEAAEPERERREPFQGRLVQIGHEVALYRSGGHQARHLEVTLLGPARVGAQIADEERAVCDVAPAPPPASIAQ